MATIATVKAPEQFMVDVNGDYHICFESITCTVADALASGTPLKDADTASVDSDTDVLGILADNKAAGTQEVRVMVRGNQERDNQLIHPLQSAVVVELN